MAFASLISNKLQTARNLLKHNELTWTRTSVILTFNQRPFLRPPKGGTSFDATAPSSSSSEILLSRTVIVTTSPFNVSSTVTI